MGLLSPFRRLRPSVPADLLVLLFCGGGPRGGPRARESTLCRGMACSLDLLGRMYMFASPGTVPRYMLPAKMGAGIGWRRFAVHGVEQGRSWCSQREWSMPYGMMCTAKSPTLRCSLSGRVSLRRATARVFRAPLADPHCVRPCCRRAQAVRDDAGDPAVVGGIRHPGAGGAYARDCVVVVKGVGLAFCVVLVLGFLGGGVYACVFGLAVRAVCHVEGGGPGGGVIEGGVLEVPLCRPCVQGGCGGPLRLYGVPLVVSTVGDEDVGGPQFIHLGGVVEVGGDGDLGGVVVADGGVGDDVVGRRFVVGGFLRRFQFGLGVERFWRREFFLGLRVWRTFGFDQVFWAPGLRGRQLGGCCCRGSEEGSGVAVEGGGSWFGG